MLRVTFVAASIIGSFLVVACGEDAEHHLSDASIDGGMDGSGSGSGSGSGMGSGSGSGSGSGALAFAVHQRDHNVELMVGFSCIFIVVGPAGAARLRRRREQI